MKIDLKKKNLYALLTHHWLGNHNYHVGLNWLICEEEPDFEMVKLFFKAVSGYTEVSSMQRFNHEEIDEGGFWLTGFVLDWTNDYDVMTKEWEQRWHESTEDESGCNGGVVATALTDLF